MAKKKAEPAESKSKYGEGHILRIRISVRAEEVKASLAEFRYKEADKNFILNEKMPAPPKSKEDHWYFGDTRVKKEDFDKPQHCGLSIKAADFTFEIYCYEKDRRDAADRLIAAVDVEVAKQKTVVDQAFKAFAEFKEDLIEERKKRDAEKASAQKEQ